MSVHFETLMLIVTFPILQELNIPEVLDNILYVIKSVFATVKENYHEYQKNRTVYLVDMAEVLGFPLKIKEISTI